MGSLLAFESDMGSLMAFEKLRVHFSKVEKGLLAAFENSNDIQKLDEYPALEFKT